MGGNDNNSLVYPPPLANGSVNILNTVVQGSTFMTMGRNGTTRVHTIEVQTSRNNPLNDPIEYVLQIVKNKDQYFHEVSFEDKPL